VDSFSAFLGIRRALYAEVMSPIFAIKYAQSNVLKSFRWSVTLLFFVKLLVQLISFLKLLKVDGVSVCRVVQL